MSKDSKYFTTTTRGTTVIHHHLPTNNTLKGEIHELKRELDNPQESVKKEAIKKVIAAMTVGKDVSMLFPDVVKCIRTTNLGNSPSSSFGNSSSSFFRTKKVSLFIRNELCKDTT